MPPPTLLTLPIELRRQILQDAFLASCSPGPAQRFANPFAVQLYFASDFPSADPDPAVYGTWGREPMSRLLHINRQLHDEAVEVLYGGDFEFVFSTAARAGDVRAWLGVLGGKRRMVRHVGVGTVVDLKMLSVIGDPHAGPAKRGIALKREAWSILRDALEGLRSVRVQIGFVRWIEGGPPGRERLLDALVELVNVFRGVETIRIDGNRLNEERVGVLETLIEKFERRE